MLKRSCAALFLGVCLAPVVAAQSQLAARVTGPVKFAGQYHAATGTWTRGSGSVSNFGTFDVLYSNTAASGYFNPIVGPLGDAAFGTIVDAGVVPSVSNPTPFALGGPLRDSSVVDVVTIGYCDFDPTPSSAGFQLDFYERYSPCTYPPDPAQLVGSAVVSGAPSNGCWFFNIDLIDFLLRHEGDGFHDDDLTLDSFGVAWRYTGTGSADAGLLVAGDPLNTDTGWAAGNPPRAGSNTYYGAVSNCAGVGSGFESGDFYWVEDTGAVGQLPGGSNCYFFGGYNNAGLVCGGVLRLPYASHHIEFGGETPILCTTCTISVPECVGNANATGVPGSIQVGGNAVPSANDATIIASFLPTGQFGIFATGLAPLAPGVLNSGNGTVCIDPGSMGGLGRFAGPGQIKNSGLAGEFSLDTNAGEWDLSMIPTSTGTYAAVAGVTSYFQAWHREPVGAGYNFTNSCSVTWQ